MTGPALSVVVPLYNEVDSVAPLHAALARMADATPGGWEFICVDDPSTRPAGGGTHSGFRGSRDGS